MGVGVDDGCGLRIPGLASMWLIDHEPGVHGAPPGGGEADEYLSSALCRWGALDEALRDESVTQSCGRGLVKFESVGQAPDVHLAPGGEQHQRTVLNQRDGVLDRAERPCCNTDQRT